MIMNTSTVVDPTDSLAVHVAEFIAGTHYGDMPAEARCSAKRAILDTLGVGLAGARAEASTILHRYTETLGRGSGAASVFGTALRVPPRFAALANGTAMHADDYDDTFHPSRVHSSAPVLAAVLAAAEQEGSPGRDLLAAFSVGAEVTCKVSLAIGSEHYRRGYHATSTCGVFGATAAVCNLRRVPLEAACAALGIAGSESAGLRENFGTMAKPLHAGRAAESGVLAASLAALGVTAAPTIFEGPRGFFMAGSGGYDADVLRGRLGNPWSYVSPGVSIKPFPSGNLVHPAMCKLKELVLAHDIQPAQVERIAVKTNRLLPVNLTYYRPETGLQGKFSMEFCLAAILTLRRAGLAEFTDAVVNRPDVQESIRRIDYSVYSDAEAAAEKYVFLTTFLDIMLKDGRRFAARVDAAKGSPADPMSEEEVAEKFRECAAFAAWPGERAEKIVDLIGRLEELDDVRALTALLRADA